MTTLPQVPHGAPAHAQPGPRFDFRPGDIASIGAVDDLTLRRIGFERAIPGPPATPGGSGSVRLLQFTEIPDGSVVFLSDTDVAQLSMEGRFRIEMLDHADSRPRSDLPTALSLTDTERARVDKHMKYVNACRALGSKFSFNHTTIKPLIQAVADAHGEKPPSTSTVFRNIKRFDEKGDQLGSAAIARRRGSGNHGTKFHPSIEKALYDCIKRSLEIPKGTADDALALLKDWNEKTHPVSPLKLPSLRTIQRRWNTMFDKYTQDSYRKGPAYAERKHGGYYERPLPALPLEEVEVDHTLFDVELVDEEAGIVFGRPDVVAIRDRCTGVGLGYGIGWELPSYASFLEAVRHAMYPKDLSAWPNLQNAYPCWGRWKRMSVDNALHFLGHDIQHAAQELKFEIVELRPGEPWMKGAEERLLGILNHKVAHNLPGTTLSNIQDRKEHLERLEKPRLTLRQFEAFLVHYLVDDYHWRAHEGLGPLRTLSDVPMRLWQRDIGKVKLRELPHPDTFAALAGHVDERTIQRHGVEWDHIVYQSEALVAIRVHPEHKPGKGGHRGTRYRVTRDPQDLGCIWIFDPYRKQRFEVPAVRQDYAAGLPLHQHQVLLARHREMVKGAVDVDGLLRIRATMLRLIEEYRNDPRTKDDNRKLARFLGKEKAKRIRSRVHPKNDSAAASAEMLDLDDPVGVVKPESRSKRAPNSTRRGKPGKPGQVRPMIGEPGELPREGERPRVQDDRIALPPETHSAKDEDAPSLDELRSRHSDWGDT